MSKCLLLFFLLFSWISVDFFAQQYLRFDDYQLDKPDQSTSFAIAKTPKNEGFLMEHKRLIKYETKDWAFVQCTPRFLAQEKNSGKLYG
jgi:hypothetical protein